MIGQTLGAYTVQRELGRGGMGAVYVGVHGLLGRTAAIKVLLPEMSKNQEIVQRFFNEARAATAIRHPGIVEVYDFGWSGDGSAYIVMEFLDGESLSARLRRLGRLPAVFAVGVARQTALALAAAHKAGIIHRDLKPDNVFLVPDVETSIGERTKLLDFGIAKLAGDPDSPNSARTTTGAIMGTPYYMSPEQCKGAAQVDHRSDLYSLGCMLHQMCCGTVPFLGEGAGDIIGKHIYVAPTPLRQIAVDVPADVEAIVLRLLAKAANDRPASAEAVAQELGQLVTKLQTSAPQVVSGVAATLPAFVPPTVPVGLQPTAPSVPAAEAKPITTLSAAATEAPRPAGPKRRTGMFIGLGGIGLVAIVAVVELVTPLGGKKADSVAHSTPADAASVTPPPVVADAVSATPPDNAELGAARQAIADQNWVAADEATRAVLARDPSNAEAKELSEKAAREQAAQLKYSDFHNALKKNDYDGASAAYSQIAETSVYKQQAHDIGTGEINGHAEKLAKAGKCKELDVFAKKMAQPWPDAQTTSIALSCKPGHAGATAGDQMADATPKSDQKAALNNLIGEKAAFDALIQQANDAARLGQYGQALQRAEEALKLDATNQQALSAAAIAACNLKDAPRAKTYIGKLKGDRQGMARQICLRNSVDVSANAPAADETKTSVADLINQAKDAYLKSQFKVALERAEEALKLEPANPSALMTAAMSACNLKQAAHARKLIDRMPSDRQPMPRQVCLRNGIDLSGAAE